MTRSSVAKIDFESEARRLRKGDVFVGVVIVRRLSPDGMPVRDMQFRVCCINCGHEHVLTWKVLYQRAVRATVRCHHCRYEARKRQSEPRIRQVEELPEAQRPRPWSAEQVLALWERANSRVAARGTV